MPLRPYVIASLFVACIVAPCAWTTGDRRTVDIAEVGNVVSEALHGYVGDKAELGTHNGVSFRRARGSLRFALKTFEDTDVTIACAFVTTDSMARSFDVIVEDSLIATRSWPASRSRTSTEATSVSSTVEILVPFALTKGKNNIAVMLRARDGSTPALREIRTIQDHLEDRSQIVSPFYSLNTSGVVR